MPATCDGLAADEMALAGQRLAEWLNAYSAKALAARFRVSLDTAKGWKAGQMPANRHLLRMVRDWGDEFLGHLFRDQLGAEVDVEVRLERVLHLVEQVKSEIEHERKARRGVVGRAVGGMVDAAGRAAGAGRGMVVGAGESVASVVTRTAAVAVICLSLSGAPDGATGPKESGGSHP